MKKNKISYSVVFCYFSSICTVLTVCYFVVFHGSWYCSDSVVFCYFSIRTVLTVWCYVIFLLELSWQGGIMLFFYWNCPDSVDFCCFSIGFWNCCDSVVFCCFSWMLVLSCECGFLLFFCTVRTVLIEK
jgi:hypothetical protein